MQKGRSRIDGGIFEHVGMAIALAHTANGWAALFGLQRQIVLPSAWVTVALPTHVCGRFVSARSERQWTEGGWSVLTDGNRDTFSDAQISARAFAERLQTRLSEAHARTRRIQL